MGIKGLKFISRWKGASVSSTGRGHCDQGLPCQDASRAVLTNDTAIIVVSDGAGSSKHAEHGAADCVRATIRGLQMTKPWSDLSDVRQRILAACKAEISKSADAFASNESDFASTLVFVAISDGVFIAGNLGDGLVAAFRGKNAEVMLKPVRGEFANETIFITSQNAKERFYIESGPLEDRDGFAIMSDGAAGSLYCKRSESLAPALTKVLALFEQDASDKVESKIRNDFMPKVVDRTNNDGAPVTLDDCSLGTLKLVQIDSDTFDTKSLGFQAEFLETKNMLGLRNRLSVFECVYKKCMADNSRIAEHTGLSVRAVRRHRQFLESQFSEID